MTAGDSETVDLVPEPQTQTFTLDSLYTNLSSALATRNGVLARDREMSCLLVSRAGRQFSANSSRDPQGRDWFEEGRWRAEMQDVELLIGLGIREGRRFRKQHSDMDDSAGERRGQLRQNSTGGTRTRRRCR